VNLHAHSQPTDLTSRNRKVVVKELGSTCGNERSHESQTVQDGTSPGEVRGSDQDVQVAHRAKIGMWVDEVRKDGALQHSEVDACGVQGIHDFAERLGLGMAEIPVAEDEDGDLPPLAIGRDHAAHASVMPDEGRQPVELRRRSQPAPVAHVRGRLSHATSALIVEIDASAGPEEATQGIGVLIHLGS
jgi:hypothetical protein